MGQLRTIAQFGKTAATSVYGFPCSLADFDGNMSVGAAGLYLQFHDKATAATAGNVPIKSFYIAAAAPTPLPSIFQIEGPINFALGLSIALSTTAATYTAATATYDVVVDIEEGQQSTDGISGLSTITNASDIFLTFFLGNAPKRVFSLTITNGEGVTVYPMFFNGTSATDGTLLHGPTLSSIADGATKTFYFGFDGYTFLLPASNASVFLSTTRPAYTGATGLASTFSAQVKT